MTGNDVVMKRIFNEWCLVLSSIQPVEVRAVLSEQKLGMNGVMLELDFISLYIDGGRGRETIQMILPKRMMFRSDDALTSRVHLWLRRTFITPGPSVWEPQLWNNM
jgi:hypothetical protein